MKNTEIITRAAIAAGLYTEAEAADLIAAHGCLPLHTYAGWKAEGWQVKPGEHAVLEVALWKYSQKVTGQYSAEDAAKINSICAGTEVHAGDDITAETQYRQPAYLFTADQVQRPAAVHIKTADEIKAYNAMLAEQRRARATA